MRWLSPPVPSSSSRAPRWRFMESATCHVRSTTSPTRPMACESEEVMEKMPMSCRTSSAAIVSLRMRESANATSSGMSGLRWWHTMSMSRCSSMVLRVYGSVGLVDAGRMLGSCASSMMSGACPPPAPSVWNVWITRPAIAARVSSTNPASFRVSVWMATWTSYSSATCRDVLMDEGVAPQSSWIFSPIAPARICSAMGEMDEPWPLPSSPKFMGNSSKERSMLWMFHSPGVMVVALEDSLGPVPPPIMVVIPETSAVSIWSGLMKWMWESIPPAVRILPSPAITSVATPITMSTPFITWGLPALPIFRM